MKFKAITYEQYRHLRGYAKGCGCFFVRSEKIRWAIENLAFIREKLEYNGFDFLVLKEFEFEIVGTSEEVKDKVLKILDYEIKTHLLDLRYA